MFNTFNTEGYKIDIVKDNSGTFVVNTPDGTILETVPSLAELVADKYITTGQVGEIKQMAEQIFAEDLNQLQSSYFLYHDKNNYFAKYFKDITFTYKLNKTFSKEIHKKIVEDINGIINSKVTGKHLPVSVVGNKLEVVFTVNPNSYLKSFKVMYDKIMIDGNYSLVDQALEMILAVDFIYDLSIEIMDLVDKYI